MTDLRFVPLAADDDLTDQWLDLLTETTGDRPYAAPPCRTDLLGSLRHAPPGTALDDWVVLAQGRVAGSLRLVIPEGAPVAHVDQLLVRPGLRRRGIGGALFGHALALARAHGRSALTSTLTEALPETLSPGAEPTGPGASSADPRGATPYGGPAPYGRGTGPYPVTASQRDGAPPPPAGSTAFATAMGGVRTAAPAGLHQWLDLGRHDPLAQGVPSTPPGYTLVTWGTITPDAYAPRVSALELSLGDIPEDSAQQEARSSYARQFETMRVGRGRQAHHTGVVHAATGELAGYTSVSKTTGNPEHLLQGMTVVDRAHRGQGLGLLLKLANLEHALRHWPRVRFVETANDETNRAMIAVNVAMGFAPYERLVSWKRVVD